MEIILLLLQTMAMRPELFVVTATPSSANMSTAARSAVITFTTDGGTGAAATATVTITQGVAGAPTLLLTSPFMVTLAHDVVTAQRLPLL